MTSKEDIRDNVIHYDDEGGGEEDTHAFDMGTLRNPKVIKENLFRRDVKPELGLCPARPIASQNSADISNFISQRLQEHDGDTSAPPYDSLATYAYEGEGSVAESLSSIESVKGETEEDYDYLNEWGPSLQNPRRDIRRTIREPIRRNIQHHHWKQTLMIVLFLFQFSTLGLK